MKKQLKLLRDVFDSCVPESGTELDGWFGRLYEYMLLSEDIPGVLNAIKIEAMSMEEKAKKINKVVDKAIEFFEVKGDEND